MTSKWIRVALTGTAVVAAFASSMSLAAQQSNGKDRAKPAPEPRGTTGARSPEAPQALRDELRDIARAFDGRSGIAVISLRKGWEVGWNAGRLFPQQSCSKLWVAITALDAADRGKLRLSDKVKLTPADLTLFHQPIRQKILAGSYETSLGDLMVRALTESDNTANDRLMREIGGPAAVRAFIARKNLGAIRFYEGERALQSRIAGFQWRPEYSYGRAFEEARAALPTDVRKTAFERYIADPYDGASPHAIADALARLAAGKLLSPASTARLLSIMGQTRTGKLRVRAGLPAGWTWSHKTGTGQQFGTRIGGINDIGLLTAPDGSAYAVAIMTVPNSTDGGAQKLMQDVARAIVGRHEADRGTRVAEGR